MEHAGTREQQAALVREVCRVCRHVDVHDTESIGFPSSSTRSFRFLHWLPDAQYRRALRLLGQSYFAEVGNLNLLDASSLLGLFPPNRRNRLIKVGIPLVPSNLVCVSIARDSKES